MLCQSREENPEKFNSRLKNKVCSCAVCCVVLCSVAHVQGRYVIAGMDNLLKQPVKDFNQDVTLIVRPLAYAVLSCHS